MRRTRPLIGVLGVAVIAAIGLAACGSSGCPGLNAKLQTIQTNANKVLVAARLYSKTNTQQSFLRTATEFDKVANQIQNLNAPSSAQSDATDAETAMRKEATDARQAAADFVANKIPAQRLAQQAMTLDDATIKKAIDALSKDLLACQ